MAENVPPQSYPQPPYPQYSAPQRRSRWWIPFAIIGGALTLFAICIIVFIIIIASLVGSAGSAFKNEPTTVKAGSVLHLTVSGMLEEQERDKGFSSIFSSEKPVGFLDALTAIRRAKQDKDIKGIYYEGGDLHMGYAKAVELREALKDFKSSGKFMYAFIETGNEFDYFLASVADSVFMPTEGLMEMNGFATVAPFLKGTFDKLGIDFYVQQFEEYKSAAEMFSRKQFSGPAREEIRSLIDQRYTIFTQAVAESRKLPVSTINDDLSRGVYLADSLKALGFVDVIKSREEVREWIKSKIHTADKNVKDSSEKLRLVSLKTYINSENFTNISEQVDESKEIAIVYGLGAIVSGGSGKKTFGGDNQIASETFIHNLRKARDNKKVKAIIIRIDSPGGSVIASDAIWEEIQATRKIKPVYASMSDVAASGGYYMAMACDTIIAHPATITGSIGVILMIPNLTKALDNIGVTVDTIATSRSALFLNPTLPFSETDKQKLYSMSEGIYKRFVSRVAESRHKSFDETRSLARGRVWTGEAAKSRGLVDVLGGLQTSIDIAKQRIGVSKDKKVAVHIYPEQEDSFSSFLKIFKSDDDDEDATIATRIHQSMEPTIQQSPVWKLIPSPIRSHVAYMLQLNQIAIKEHTVMAMPLIPDIQ